MKLLPQFSIRLMLGVTALAAGVFSVMGLAVRGHGWAIGVSLGVVGLVIALATYAAFFGILWVFSLAASPFLNRRIPAGQLTLAGTTSPFADASRIPAVENAVDAIVVNPSEASGAEDSIGGERQS